MNDVRYALRQFNRNPGFAVAAVLILSLGIGANAAVFSVIDTVLLKPLAFPEADQLVRLSQSRKLSPDATSAIAPVRLEEWNDLNSSFEAITGYYSDDASDTTGDLPERIRRAWVAPRFLDAWKVLPALGRGFSAEEHQPGGPSAVLISDRYWRHRFGADPAVLDRSVRIGQRSHPVIGVMPAAFRFPEREVDLWFPVSNEFAQNAPDNRDMRWYTGIGRLQAGVTLEEAVADLGLVQAQLGEQYPDPDSEIGVHLELLKDHVLGNVAGSLWLVYGAVTVLLLITCVNIAALLLSRAARRNQEIAVRLSLGASNRAVIRQLLTETGVLAIAGAFLGLLVAAGAIALFQSAAVEVPRADELAIDARIVGYTLLTAIPVALISGLLPAVRGLQAGAAITAPGAARVSARHATQWTLVGVQVALSITLLAGAGLLVRSIEKLSDVDPGFEPAHVLTFRVSGNWGETVDYAGVTQRIDGTLEALRGLPGVEAAATSWSSPGIPTGYEEKFELAEGRSETEAELIAEWRTVSPSYFETLQVPLVSGDLCRQSPGSRAASEAMINRSFADTYFSGRSVIGSHLSWESGTMNTRITGIVGDARETGLDQIPTPTVYACHSAPNPFPLYLLRVEGEPMATAASVRQKIHELEPLRSVYDSESLEQKIDSAFSTNQIRTLLLSFFAVTALILACVG
ncbi:MAG: ABC transporter permease, partial [Xanthomonadales bacterium]|nr:ABC transporter permease [Xanthomonadales bacterium]